MPEEEDVMNKRMMIQLWIEEYAELTDEEGRHLGYAGKIAYVFRWKGQQYGKVSYVTEPVPSDETVERVAGELVADALREMRALEAK